MTIATGIDNTYISRVREFLTSYLEEKSLDLGRNNPVVQDALGRLADFAIRGKMIRAGLVPLACELSGGEVTASVLEVAGGIELFHSSLLIQDDIIDQDDVRRGRPAMHAQYQRLAASLTDHSSARHFGRSMSLCLSSVSLVSAFEVLSRSGTDDQKKSQIASLWSGELVRVGFAEMEEVQLAMLEDEAPLSRIWSVYKGKTAGYSFTLPLLTGLVLAGATASLQEAIKPVGELLGLIFQVKDDQLGLFGNAKELGKPVGSDVHEKKKTIIYAYLLAETPPKVRSRIRTIYASSRITEEDVEYVRWAAIEYGIDSLISRLIQGFKLQLDSMVEELSVGERYRDALKDLAGFARSRTK